MGDDQKRYASVHVFFSTMRKNRRERNGAFLGHGLKGLG